MIIVYIFDKTKSDSTNYSLKNPQPIVSLVFFFSKNQKINRVIELLQLVKYYQSLGCITYYNVTGIM